MAYVNGIPSTDLSRADQEYVKAVAEEAASGGGGASGMVITITESDSGDPYMNKTFAEIYSAITNGIVPVAVIFGDYHYLTHADSTTISFSTIYVESNEIYTSTYTINTNNNVEYSSIEYQPN